MKVHRSLFRLGCVALGGALLQAAGCTPVDWGSFVGDFAREALAAYLF